MAVSRPKKHRKICHYPKNLVFSPADSSESQRVIRLSVDEYETIRLIDKEGFSQEQCCRHMGIARTTVQMIYASAREKLARMLVDGLTLEIGGGDVTLCRGGSDGCGNANCFKQQYHEHYEKPKGDSIMRIAVTYEDGNIFQHFGHTRQFKVYDIQEGQVVASQVVDTAGSGHGALAGVLAALNADILICGGIGGGAQTALAAAGIRLFGGVSGDADQAVNALLANKLAYDPNVRCDHHGEHHHHEDDCGSHGCGGHCGGHH